MMTTNDHLKGGGALKKGENIRIRSDGRYEARYIKDRDVNGKIKYGYCYGQTYEEAKEKRDYQLKRLASQRHMNLLIFGKGDHGLDAYEIAKATRIFEKISFLDDNQEIDGTIGKWCDYTNLMEEYPLAIVAVGDEKTRKMWTEKLITEGFIIPTLVHPTAFVPEGMTIGTGSIICARTTIAIGASVGRYCIITSGSTVPRKTRIPDWGYFDFDKLLEHYHEEYYIPVEKGE